MPPSHAPRPAPPLRAQCGCRCTRCCFEGNPNNCTVVSVGTCPYECLETSKDECGIQFSNARQSYFCAIPRPSSWPAMLQVHTAHAPCQQAGKLAA
jgi:hypothetical protein